MNRSKVERFKGSKSGSDFLQLRPADAPPGGLAAWLSERLRAAIADGRLPIGAKLPASRELAAELRVSRGVITEAYQRLREDGHVAGQGRAGTVVVAAPAIAPEPVRRPENPQVFTSTPDASVFGALRAASARVDLAPGVPDLAAFPRAAWLRAERSIVGGAPASAFGYGDPRGVEPLRTAVAGWVARYRGIRVDPDDVLVVAGFAQALGLLSRVLTTDGVHAIAVEDPSSLGARQHLNHWGMAAPPVTVDADGVRVDELTASGAGAVLLTPAHQFPTGVVLAGQRRRELMRWAADGGLVVEDDYDAEHRYDRPPVPAVHSLLPEQVVYGGSISKVLAPALRIGWVIAPPRYRAALAEAKWYADLGNAVLPQLALADLMTSGELERQLRFMRKRHRRRRDAMVAAIAAQLPGAVVHGAAAGLHVMVTFDDADFSDVDLAAAALARGVKVQPLSWHRQQDGPPGLVLGYAARTPTAIVEGIDLLSQALGDVR